MSNILGFATARRTSRGELLATWLAGGPEPENAIQFAQLNRGCPARGRPQAKLPT